MRFAKLMLIGLMAHSALAQADDCQHQDVPPYSYWAIDEESGGLSVMYEGVERYSGPLASSESLSLRAGAEFKPRSEALAYFRDVRFFEVCEKSVSRKTKMAP